MENYIENFNPYKEENDSFDEYGDLKDPNKIDKGCRFDWVNEYIFNNGDVSLKDIKSFFKGITNIEAKEILKKIEINS